MTKNEKLNGETLCKGLALLEAAFNYDLTGKQAEAYIDKLSKDFTDDEFMATVDKILEQYDRFPSISIFYKLGSPKKNTYTFQGPAWVNEGQ